MKKNRAKKPTQFEQLYLKLNHILGELDDIRGRQIVAASISQRRLHCDASEIQALTIADLKKQNECLVALLHRLNGEKN